MADKKFSWWDRIYYGKDQGVRILDTPIESNRTITPIPSKRAIGNTVGIGPNIADIPNRRQSQPQNFDANLIGLQGKYRKVDIQFLREVIPLIRKLMMANEDVGQAIHNVVTLGNTGHRIFFDRSVSTDQVDKMRNHIINRQEEWAPGQPNMDGVINKLIAQILTGGAASCEWVPKNDLTGVETILLINPEEIQFVLDKRLTKYLPYQIVKSNGILNNKKVGVDNLVPLNTNTYKYYAINGDGELPYGFPPYLSVLPKISTKANMDANIDFVVDQMGLIGFLQALVEKPQNIHNVSDTKYLQELEAYLDAAKSRLAGGLRDGIVVGFKEETEFAMQSAAKSYDGIGTLYKNNEMQIASSLKQDASLWGRDYNTSEASIKVVFSKLLSELKNIQNPIKSLLEFGYALELRLAGYRFNYLRVEFNRSTISDDLKFFQAEEIKLRNVQTKIFLGIVNQEQAADELGYEVPAYPESQVPLEVLAGGQDPAAIAAKNAETQKKKDASDKKVRDKNNPTK